MGPENRRLMQVFLEQLPIGEFSIRFPEILSSFKLQGRLYHGFSSLPSLELPGGYAHFVYIPLDDFISKVYRLIFLKRKFEIDRREGRTEEYPNFYDYLSMVDPIDAAKIRSNRNLTLSIVKSMTCHMGGVERVAPVIKEIINGFAGELERKAPELASYKDLVQRKNIVRIMDFLYCIDFRFVENHFGSLCGIFNEKFSMIEEPVSDEFQLGLLGFSSKRAVFRKALMDSVWVKSQGIQFLQNWCYQQKDGSRLDLIGTLLANLGIAQRQETLSEIIVQLKVEALHVVEMALHMHFDTRYTENPFLEDDAIVHRFAKDSLEIAEDKRHAGFTQVFSHILSKLDNK